MFLVQVGILVIQIVIMRKPILLAIPLIPNILGGVITQATGNRYPLRNQHTKLWKNTSGKYRRGPENRILCGPKGLRMILKHVTSTLAQPRYHGHLKVKNSVSQPQSNRQASQNFVFPSETMAVILLHSFPLHPSGSWQKS